MIERSALNLEWSGQEMFANAPLRDWLVDGEVAGRTRTGGVLTFATVHDAGHLVRLSTFPSCTLKNDLETNLGAFRPTNTGPGTREPVAGQGGTLTVRIARFY